jgi:hypothetical protein
MTTKTCLSIFTILAVSGLSLQNSASAQLLLDSSLTPVPYSELKTLTGYQPSVLASEDAAKSIYDRMPIEVFKGNSGCFQRTHDWAFTLSTRNNIKSMKVFLFFTRRYQREFDYKWAYHVAPLIPVRLADGTIEERVFDPTFTSRPSWEKDENESKYDNKPIPVSEWLKYFIYPGVECPLVDNYRDYYEFQEQHYCYTMKAPM